MDTSLREGKIKGWLKAISLLTVDLAILHFITVLAFVVRFPEGIPDYNFEAYKALIIWLSVAAIFLLRIYGLFPAHYRVSWQDIAVSVFVVTVLYNILLMALSYLSREFAFPRTVLLMQFLPQLIILLAWRRLLWNYQRTHRQPQRVYIMGERYEIDLLIDRSKDFHWVWVGDAENGQYTAEELQQTWVEAGADTIVIGRTIPPDIRRDIVARAITAGLKVCIVPDFYDVAMKSSRLNQMEDISLLEINPKQIAHRNREIKRVLDIFLSLLLLPFIIPLGVLISLLIWLETGRPIFYCQERVTTGGKKFQLYKFRTMKVDAEKLTGPTLAGENDQRVTRVGRLLRACRLDELPQIINVLAGDMSIVGPRPERPFFINQFEKEVPGYGIRHQLQCGITGMAQVNGRYSTRPEDKLVMDLEYGLNHSIWLDFKLILQTIKVVLIKKSST